MINHPPLRICQRHQLRPHINSHNRRQHSRPCTHRPRRQPSHRRSPQTHPAHPTPHPTPHQPFATTRVADNEFHPNQRTNPKPPPAPHPNTSANTPQPPQPQPLHPPAPENSPTTANAAKSGSGNARRSNLPAEFNTTSSSTTHTDGTMYDGNTAPNDAFTTSRSISPGDAYPTSCSAPPGPHDHGGCGVDDVGGSCDRRLDLTQLDALTTQLHLEISTAQVFDAVIAVFTGQHPHQITGPEQSRPAGSPSPSVNGFAMNRSAVKPAAPV